MEKELLITAIKCIIGSSLFFVWVIRYDNIIKEFEEYKYPNWLRDFVGILKFTFFLFILMDYELLQNIGLVGIAGLMLAAFLTHIKVKNQLYKMLPSFSLMSLSIIALITLVNK
eukprot:COSAG01_NODE_52_length_31456_cov_125.226648_29_plen_114_part_00